MKPIYRFLIIVEAIAGLGPLVLLLGLGLITVPVAFMGILDGYYGAVVLLLIEIGGFLGMIALISVFMHILEPNTYSLSFKKLRLFIICGLCSIFAFVLMSGIGIELTWFLVPIAVVLHFLYLGRQYVFGSSSGATQKGFSSKPDS